MGVPSNIFEPEHISPIHPIGPKSDAPEKISPLVQKLFDVGQTQTVDRNRRIVFDFGAPTWCRSFFF
jgi:hypothetical protein